MTGGGDEPPSPASGPATGPATGPALEPARGGAARPGGAKRRRWWLRILLFLIVPPALYFGAAEIAMRLPVNGDADPLAGTIDLYFCSNGPHVDIWVPVDREGERWADVLPLDYKVLRDGYLAIGWGDRAFYTQVPNWSDLTVPIALKGALLPTESTIRVTSWAGWPNPGPWAHLVSVDVDGYHKLCAHIRDSMKLGPDGRLTAIDFKGNHYAADDRCFEANGSYHMFHTCNNWTNDALKRAGKRAARWAPLPRGVVHQLPNNSGRR